MQHVFALRSPRLHGVTIQQTTILTHTSPLISEFLQVVPAGTSEFIFCYVTLFAAYFLR